ncbi:hypothetical protein Tco_0479442 [Tanacetum coccineum]
MDDPSMTMEEYIKYKEEKARRHGKVFNWQTATYGKIKIDDDLHDLSSVEAEAIVINDNLAWHNTLECKSQVNTPINDEIDFRISFDESDDEDYTIIYDKNSFSYKIISVNNLKTDSENDYEKVMPSIPSPEPTISCFDDLDFFNDFENEFPAIVYNDAQKSKSDLLTESILNPQHIEEFYETSMSKYDKEEQNILYFNDLFPFNIIGLDDLKSEKDSDDNDIDIIQPSENNEITHGSTMLFETSHDMPDQFLPLLFTTTKTHKFLLKILDAQLRFNQLITSSFRLINRSECLNFYTLVLSSIDFAYIALPPREQRHRFLRYEGLEYLDIYIVDFEGRLARIHRREVHRVLIFDFEGLPDLMAEGLTAQMLMEQRDNQGVSVFTSRDWRRMLDIRGPLFQLGGVRRRMSWREFILALGLHTDVEMQTAGFGVCVLGGKAGVYFCYYLLITYCVTTITLTSTQVLSTGYGGGGWFGEELGGARTIPQEVREIGEDVQMVFA